jgi:hypothetical protein
MRKLNLALLLAFSAGLALADNKPTAADLARHASGIWSIEPAGTLRRWVVVHDPASQESLLHIEVLGLEAKKPIWAVKRLAAHMAINQSALLASIQKPLEKGLVYPEQYENDLMHWKKDQTEGKAKVCSTSVGRCLQNQW